MMMLLGLIIASVIVGGVALLGLYVIVDAISQMFDNEGSE